VDDAVAQGERTRSVTHTAASADVRYDGVNVPDLAVQIIDNEGPRIVVTPTAGLVTTEGSNSAFFTVALATTPTSDVIVTLNSSNAAEGTASPAALTFTPTNALMPQTVTGVGTDDLLTDGDVVYTVTGSAVSADAGYNGIPVPVVSLTNLDNDAAPPPPPVGSISLPPPPPAPPPRPAGATARVVKKGNRFRVEALGISGQVLKVLGTFLQKVAVAYLDLDADGVLDIVVREKNGKKVRTRAFSGLDLRPLPPPR
jgi:hypothetical protein